MFCRLSYIKYYFKLFMSLYAMVKQVEAEYLCLVLKLIGEVPNFLTKTIKLTE